MRKFFLFFLLLISSSVFAQDINCKVTVISPKITLTNKQIFKTLENSITEFINNRKWTNDKIQSNERIDCTFLIDITALLGVDEFQADISIQSSRPVYGSSYNTVILNQRDEGAVFKYTEFQPLDYQEAGNVMQLTSLLAFYLNIIIGMDYDTFSLEGGNPYYAKAQNILNLNVGNSGWNSNDGNSNKNRYYLIENLSNERFKPLREAMYKYHISGLDVMHKDVAAGRAQIMESLKGIQKVFKLLPNAMLLKVFFNAKADELVRIYQDAPSGERAKAYEVLTAIDPANINKYNAIINKK